MPTQTPDRASSTAPRTAAVHPRIHGREAELELLGERIGDAAAGHGAVVLVEGPAGIGKSRLLTEGLAIARRSGARRLTGRAHELDEGTPLGPLLSAVVSGERRLLDPTALRALAGAPDGRFWLLEELHGALERAALDGPLAIALDDLQWADPATAWALRTLVPRLASLPVVWLLASRDAGALADLAVDADRVVLDGLAPASVAALAADVLGGAPDPAVLDLAGRAGGNPFLLVELLRGLVEEQRVQLTGGTAALAGGPALPARVRETMGVRLARLSDPAREAVELASVLGPRFSATRLAELTGQPAHALVGPLREALSADLLSEDGDALAFRHDLLREAVYGALPKPVRDALHRDVADALLAGGATAAEAARHLLAATLPADRRTVEVLRRAARELAPTSPSAAADLGLRAMEQAGALDGALGPLAAETIPTLVAAGRVEDARALADRALTGHLAPEQEARVRLALVQVLVRTDLDAARVECRRALALDGVDAATRADLLALQARAVRLADDAEGDALTAELAAAALDAARAAGRAAAEVCALVELGVLAFRAGRWSAARALLETAVDVADRGGSDARALTIPELWLNAVVALGDGVDEAVRDTTRRGDVARRDGRQWELRVWTMSRAQLLLDAGRLADARAEAEALLAMHGESGTGSLGVATARFVLARVAEHVDGRPEDGARPGGLADPVDVPRAVRAALADGDRVRAAALAADVRALAAANPGVASLDGAAAHATALLTDDAALLADAVAIFRRGPRVLALASALEDLGRVTADVAVLDEALRLTAEAGAEHDAARIRRRLRALGVRRRRTTGRRPAAGAGVGGTGWDALTSSERQVAALIAAGATNREAAEQLFLSPHTVSTHLRHTFTKLGIRSRVELANRAPR